MSGAIDNTMQRQSELEPASDVARLFPPQGTWSEEEYLALNTNRLVEFVDGSIEVLPMPTMMHQLIMLFLYDALKTFVSPGNLGRVLVAPFRVQVRRGKFREPDVLYMKAEHFARMGNEYWDGADLVMEIVSEDNRRHDLETKREEYAQAGISEYWIVDPQEAKITVLTLDSQTKTYSVHGVFAVEARASSQLLPGFVVDVTTAFSHTP
jgi:Uma2 family endonuclease